MTLTVIQRRLRHLKSVSILNVSLIKNFTEDVTLKIVPCFIIIEDIKGQPVYVSEIQTGSHIIIQFNEFPQLPHVMSSIHLKIIGKVPAHLLEYPTDDTWVTMAEYTVDFNQLFKISSSELEQRIDEVNVPIFEFFDGCFAMKNTMKPATEAIESVPSSKSFTYNSLLKLNKILEYVTQMRQELSETSKKMDSLVDQLPSNYNNEPIRKACDKLRKEIDDKRAKIDRLISRSTTDSVCSNASIKELKMNDEYGVIYSDFSNVRHRLQSHQLRKFQLLITIFQQTKLFTREGYIIPNEDNTSIFCMTLEIVEAKDIVGSQSREKSNTTLGYYLLFVYLLAEKILYVPLPHKLSFYGSRSLVDSQLPLYLTPSPSQQHYANFGRAVEYFNSNIMQIKQYLEHHR